MMLCKNNILQVLIAGFMTERLATLTLHNTRENYMINKVVSQKHLNVSQNSSIFEKEC